ncbi:MAG: 3-hydroxyacyl-CoA dehydrogenase NAD-binding domain-containing protein, partial [Nocardioides sp.]
MAGVDGPSRLQRVGVVGGGLMGSGIAEVTAKAGLDTVVVEVGQEAADAARARIDASLERALSRGKIDQGELEAIRGRLRVETDLEALADRDLVVEAASEREDVKLELFQRIGAILEKGEAILTSNTSSIPIVKL